MDRIKSVLRGETTRVSVGWNGNGPKPKNYVETIKGVDGKMYDVFQEGKKQYVYKDGAKVSRIFVEEETLAAMPLFCPKCKKVMKGRLDTKMYNIHGVCFNCTIKIQNKMMIDGTWRTYEKQRVLLNKISFIKELLKEANDIKANGINETINFVGEDGKLEKWKNVDKEKIEEFLNSEIKNLEEELEKSEKELSETGELIVVNYKEK